MELLSHSLPHCGKVWKSGLTPLSIPRDKGMAPSGFRKIFVRLSRRRNMVVSLRVSALFATSHILLLHRWLLLGNRASLRGLRRVEKALSAVQLDVFRKKTEKFPT